MIDFLFIKIVLPSIMAACAVTKIATMRQYLVNYPMDFAKIYVILMLSLISLCEGTKQVRHSILRNSCTIQVLPVQ